MGLFNENEEEDFWQPTEKIEQLESNDVPEEFEEVFNYFNPRIKEKENDELK